MSTNGTDLSSLLVGGLRGTSGGRALRKSAARIVGGSLLSQQEADKIRADESKRIQQRKMDYGSGYEPSVNSGSGNAAYDALKDVRAHRAKNLEDKTYNEYARYNPEIVKPKSFSEIRAVTPKQKSWGDHWLGKAVGYAHAPIKFVSDVVAQPISWLISAPKGTSYADWSAQWAKDYVNNAGADYDDFAHDVANNWQINLNSAGHSVGSTLKWVGHHIDPRTWLPTHRARDLRESYRNTRDNDEKEFIAEQDARLANFRDRDLRYVNRKEGDLVGNLAAWNYAGNTMAGQFAGDALTLYGAGKLGKLMSWLLGKFGKGAGYALRGTAAVEKANKLHRAAVLARIRAVTIARNSGSASSAARIASLQAQRAARAAQQAAQQARVVTTGVRGAVRRAAAQGTEEMVNTVSFPFRAAGGFQNMAQTVPRGLSYGWRNVVTPTFHNGIMRPINAGARFLSHPGASLRNMAMHPLQAGKRFGGWAIDTLNPAWKLYTHPMYWQGRSAYDAMRNLGQGRYGDAAKDIGGMGLYGAASSFGPWGVGTLVGGSLLHGLYQGMFGKPDPSEIPQEYMY